MSIPTNVGPDGRFGNENAGATMAKASSTLSPVLGQELAAASQALKQLYEKANELQLRAGGEYNVELSTITIRKVKPYKDNAGDFDTMVAYARLTLTLHSSTSVR